MVSICRCLGPKLVPSPQSLLPPLLLSKGSPCLEAGLSAIYLDANSEARYPKYSLPTNPFNLAVMAEPAHSLFVRAYQYDPSHPHKQLART